MFLQRIFPTRPAVAAGRALFQSAAAQARTPAFYLHGGVADTVEGRFELYALHVVLLLHRLNSGTEQAIETRQALFDAFLQSLDDALREIGVGDLTVPKKMKKLGAALYGRVKSYAEALAPKPDPERLRALAARTVLDGGDPDRATAMASYIADAAGTLAAQDDGAILAGVAAWPEYRP